MWQVFNDIASPKVRYRLGVHPKYSGIFGGPIEPSSLKVYEQE